MPQSSERYKKFLSAYNFYSNSISFRISSSKALEKWKNVQAFQLNQLINGRFYFPQNRREILLLKYDLWSRWLYEVENLCIELSDNIVVTEDDIRMINSLSKKTVEKYIDVMINQHPEQFDQPFTKIWLEMHAHINDYCTRTISSFVGMKFDDFYTSIVDLLVEALQYTLTEIHELDMIFCRFEELCDLCSSNSTCPINRLKEARDPVPFTIITPLNAKVLHQCGVCLTEEKLKIYKKYFDFRTIYIKNYTDEVIHKSIINRIEALDFSIDFRRSVTE